MKVLFTRFPLDSRYGGAEVQTIALMQGLLDRGHAVAFLGSCPTLLRLCDERGIPAAELQIGSPPVTKWGAISFLWRKRTMRAKLEAAIREFGGLDALCMLSLSEKLLLTPFALQKGLRAFWIEHDRLGPWLEKNPWLPQLLNLSRSVTTIAVSGLSRKLYVAMGWDPQTIVAIPNGIDETRLTGGAGHFVPTRSSGLMRVGTIARLTPDKGVDVLIQAIADMPEADCTIVGSGPEEGYLRRLITDLTARESSNEPRIRLHRTVDDLGALYRSLNVFVLPSRDHDPFGLVAAEAMLCQTATVVTDACGIASHIEADRDAIVVPANDPGALRQALIRLREKEYRTQMAQQGQKAAREKFSLQTMVDAYEKVLR